MKHNGSRFRAKGAIPGVRMALTGISIRVRLCVQLPAVRLASEIDRA